MKKLILLVFGLILLAGYTYGEAFVPTNKVIGYWSFDEGAGSTIYNVANRGTFDFNNWTGSPGFVKGKVGGWAFFQNGSVEGDSLGNVSINPSNIGNFSWSIWLNFTEVASTQCILYHADSGFGLQDLCLRSGELQFRVGNGTTNFQANSGALVANRTYHVVATVNASDKLYLYINGTNIVNTSIQGGAIGGLSPFYVGSTAQTNEFFNGWYDEIIYFNKSLGVADVQELYRNGLGKGFPTRQITPALISPAYQLGSSNASISFNFTGFSSANGFNMTNATLYLYNSTSLVNITNITLTGNVSNNSRIIVNNLPLNQYTWNIYLCGRNNTGTQCNTNLINYTLNIGGMVNTNTFNSTTYETARESFYSNISIVSGASISSATLYYDGTGYSATTTSIGGNDYLINRGIDIPTGTGSKNWFWSLIFSNGFNQNLSTNSQTNTLSNLSICGSAPQNILYYNISFKNETTTQERINASVTSSTWNYWLGQGTTNKTLSYSNSAENKEYNFCFSPQSRNVNIDLSFSYDNAESEQRTYSPNTFLLTNSSTSTTLFLLPSTSGQYVTFQVINTAQQALSGVEVTASRSGIGTIETGTTDSSGSVTFFLNPNFAYNFVFSKTGFDDFETTITPTQTSYTITMGGTSGSTNSTNSASGMSFVILPSQRTLNNGTTYNFNLTLNSSYWSLDSWGFTLQNKSGYVFDSETSSSSNGGFLSTNLNTGENKTIVMNYFWIINGVYNNATVTWGVIDLSGNGLSIFQFFTDLRNYVSLGFFGLDDVGLGIITFFAIFLITGVMSYKFGINSPAAIMAFIFSLTMFFDIGLGLVPNPIGAIPHAPTFLMAIIFVAMFFREMGR